MYQRVAEKILPGFGIKPADFDTGKDSLLGLLVFFPVILACKPIFIAIDGNAIMAEDTKRAILWAIVAVVVSLLSVNWNFALGAPFFLISFRGVIGFVLRGGFHWSYAEIVKTVIVIVTSGAVGSAFFALKPYEKSEDNRKARRDFPSIH